MTMRDDLEAPWIGLCKEDYYDKLHKFDEQYEYDDGRDDYEEEDNELGQLLLSCSVNRQSKTSKDYLYRSSLQRP